MNKLPPMVKGMVFSNVFGMLIIWLSKTTVNSLQQVNALAAGGLETIFIFSEFVLVPLVMGIICIRFWLKEERRIRYLLPFLILNTGIALGWTFLLMGEGAICLAIVSPLLLVFMLIGLIIGRSLYESRNNTLKASTMFIIAAVFLVDVLSTHHHSAAVTDVLTINAPREQVWKYVAAHPVNQSKPGYWLFRMGMPAPVQSTMTGSGVGARRKCIFSNGATFEEVVVESVTDSVFTFDIVAQPRDPEIIGHIDIRRGQFVLRENADGTTTLTGTSWYDLYVFPAWYYDLWAEDITREVHLRVMHHIKELAEKNV